MAEKKQELEKRLQDVTGQLGNVKKIAKKGWYFDFELSCDRIYILGIKEKKCIHRTAVYSH